MGDDPDRGVGRRALLGWSLGFAAGLCGVGQRARPFGARTPGPIALWAADRAGHAVYGLDADAIVVTRREVVAPLRVRGDGAGGWSALSGVDGLADGRRRWVRLEAGERPRAPAEVDRGPVSLDPHGSFGVAGGPIVRVARSLRPDGSRAAWVLRSVPRDRAHLERWVRRARSRSSWQRAYRLDLPWTARALAAGTDGAWVVGDRVPEIWFVTTTGRVVIRRALLDLDGAEDAIVASRASGGGVWIAACGALARLDRVGGRLPGQGGFGHLVSLAAV